jgi:hypothetical protein
MFLLQAKGKYILGAHALYIIKISSLISYHKIMAGEKMQEMI